MPSGPLTLNRDEIAAVSRRKHGDLRTTGWRPRARHAFGYFTPDEHYDAMVSKLAIEGCDWIDVGGGRDVFPDNAALAEMLAARCRRLVAVDPSPTVHENSIAHERVQARIENYSSMEPFDLATMRMVVEHVDAPRAAVDSLNRLLRSGGRAVVYTVNKWSPVTLASWFTPFWLHHPVKRLFWGTEEKDTFPVVYRMNTRRELSRLFQQSGFREEYFAYLDDCRTLQRSRILNYLELTAWRVLHAMSLHYPETCLLGVYRKVQA